MPNTNRMLPAALAAALVVAPGFAFAQTARDGTPSNPASDAVGRTVDRATGQPTRPDGTPGNPPSTAVGRAVDRMTGQPTSPDGTGNNPPGTAVGRALDRAGNAVSDATRSSTPHGTPAAATTATREVRPSNRASKIIGANIYNEEGQSIGEVEDLIVQRDGAGPVAVVSVGGFLGIGARLVAVPLNELRFAEGDSRWTLSGATKESLQARPVVSYAARG